MSSSRRDQVMEVVDKLAPLLGELEDQRQIVIKKRSRGFGFVGIAAIVWLVIAGCIAAASSEPMMALVVSLIGFGISFAIIHSIFIGKYVQEYESAYKQRVLTEVTRAVQPGMHYKPHDGISKALFKSSGLIKSRIDRYHSEDLFLGDVGETEVYFSEVKAERKDTSRDSKGNTRTTWKTVFDGVFFMADFHKEFSTWATVTPDFAEKNFGWLGKKLQKLGGSVVHLENPDFEKAFVVRGGDQVVVRYILTPDMQERLLQLREVFCENMMFAFKDSKVVLLFNTQSNWFEPSFKVASYDVGQIERFIAEMQSCCSIVEMMNLNTRIWTK